VIGLKDKFIFNGGVPTSDGPFVPYVQYPTFAGILSSLFLTTVNNVLGLTLTTLAPSNYPRTDVFAVYLTGIPNLNLIAGGVAGELLRLNTSIPPTVPANQQRYGVLAGDNAGFPNGRRPGDDIVDITVQVVMGALCLVPKNPWCTASNAPVGNVKFTDGSPQYVTDFDYTFPYLTTPVAGYTDTQAYTGSSAAGTLQPTLVRMILPFW